jgi:hypothetical protein
VNDEATAKRLAASIVAEVQTYVHRALFYETGHACAKDLRASIERALLEVLVQTRGYR